MEEISKYKHYGVVELYKRIFKYALKSWHILLISIILMVSFNYLSNIFPLITQ